MLWVKKFGDFFLGLEILIICRIVNKFMGVKKEYCCWLVKNVFWKNIFGRLRKIYFKSIVIFIWDNGIL